MTNRPYSVLIVDDHPLFRDGVKALVGSDPGFRITAEAGSQAEAQRLAREARPELILLDLSLPDGGGVGLIRELSVMLPDVGIIVLSMHSRIEMVAESFQAGARGYVIKESAGERLIQAMNAVARKEHYLDSAVSPKVISKLLDFAQRKAQMADSSYAVLTRREQQILRLLAEGRHPKDIAETLFITRKTVENHRTNIMTKLGLRTPVELVRYAVRMGLIEVEDAFPPGPDEGSPSR